ncbi:MAG: ATP-binding protein [Thermomicrobiales bacterium]
MEPQSPSEEHPVSRLTPLPVMGARLPRLPLPAPLTALVGRQQEITAIRALLDQHHARLVTLTGPGGVGKTRLALKVAQDLEGADRFRDGVYFVALANAREPDDVLLSIATTLQVREAAPQVLDDLLIPALRHREALLVLDNLEQVLSVSPDLAALLHACPSVKILATSRELLHVSGEHRFIVPPLSLENEDGPVTFGETTTSGAMRLFAARAQAVQPDFQLDAKTAPVVAEICRRVDCLPLGIELAAARLRHLSPASLLDGLDARLSVLTGGPADQPARFRTMRDAIGWSYNLLTRDEQTLFRRLAIFAGGFTREAGAAVVNLHPGETRESAFTFDQLASLIDKSLLQIATSATGHSRYHMLETVREFGLAQLAGTGEAQLTRQSHAAWYRAFASDAFHHIAGSKQAAWLDRIADEHANLRLTLAWFTDQGDTSELLRLVATLAPFWEERSHLIEGRAWLERAAALSRHANAAERLPVATAAGTLAWLQGDFARATCWHQQALALARQLGDRAAEAVSLSNLGVQAQEVEDYGAAIVFFDASLSIGRDLDSPRHVIQALHNFGVVAWLQGERVVADELLEEALTMARKAGESWTVPSTLVALGHVAFDQGDLEQAVVRFRESLDTSRARGNQGQLIDALEGLARVGATRGAAESTTRVLAAATSLRQAIGMARSASELTYFEPIIATLRNMLGDDAFARAWESGSSLWVEDAIAEAIALVSRPRSVPAHGLTARELDVLRLLAQGHSNREISDRLFISQSTAARHVANIFAKLDVDSRSKAAAFAHRHGLIAFSEGQL